MQIIKHEHSYHGTTTGNKIAGAVVGALIGVGNPAVSGDDNRVKLKFRCK
jgi:hypothetical protein